jgi:hypothetical protein
MISMKPALKNNGANMKFRPSLILTLGTYQLLTAGCTGVTSLSGDETLSIKSQPTSASVFIMDKKVGVTPLEIRQETLYPTTYDPAKQDQYGTVTLKHEGCADYTQHIGYRELAKDMDISLVCGEANEKLMAEPSVSDSDTRSNHPDAKRQPMQKKAVKQRLIELDQLKQEGLISPEEYRSIRQRILNAI